jgi:hypothetical protein
MAIAMIDTMDNIVKDDLKDDWVNAKWTWFVKDASDPWQTRLPGLMKEEWSTSNGAMAA